MPDAIDSMIEDWAKDRSESVRVSLDTPLKGFEDFSLTKTPATPLDAARAVREAVAAKTGRRPKVDFWKPVAAKALGISRLFAKRWQGVLDAGIEAGLFRIDSDTLSFPILVALDPAPEITVIPEITPDAPEPRKRRSVSEIISDLSTMPDGWVGPKVFRCGHENWPHHGLTPDDPKQVEAREAGFCCQRVREATASRNRLNPSAANRHAPVKVHWRVKGLHTPVPKALRRSPERERSGGFPGLCCDPETGLYIGGIGNHCRHHHKGKARCVVHGIKGK